MILGKAAGDPQIFRLQTALQGLAARANDPRVATGIDGKLGPMTVAAVNVATGYTVNLPADLRTGRLTAKQVKQFLPQLTQGIETAKTAVAAPPPTRTAVSSSASRPAGGIMPAPAYYQPAYYPPQQPPEARFDAKLFIPAQFEHVSFNPATVALVLGLVVLTTMVVQRRNKEKK